MQDLRIALPTHLFSESTPGCAPTNKSMNLQRGNHEMHVTRDRYKGQGRRFLQRGSQERSPVRSADHTSPGQHVAEPGTGFCKEMETIAHLDVFREVGSWRILC